MILVVLKLPAAWASTPALLDRMAKLTDLVRADLQHRLAGTLPRVLQTHTDGERLRHASVELARAGVVSVVFDPAVVPTDEERLVTHTVERRGTIWAVQAHEQGPFVDLPGSAIALVQRGVRTTSTVRVETTKERKLDLGKALLTGGLLFGKTVEKKTSQTRTDQAAFLLIHRSDGEPDVILHERQVNYRFLEGTMEPASSVNLARTQQLLQQLAPRAPVDDRAARPGFTLGFSATGRDGVDVALHAVHLAHLMGAAR